LCTDVRTGAAEAAQAAFPVLPSDSITRPSTTIRETRSRACLCPDQRRHRCDGPAGLKTVIHRDDCPGEAVVLPVPDCPSRGAGELTKGPAGLSSRRRCDLPPFHALAARRTLAGCTRHKAAVRSSTTSRAKGIARHTPKMTSSHAGHGRGQAPHDLTGNDHKVVPADTVSDGESPLAASACGTPSSHQGGLGLRAVLVRAGRQPEVLLIRGHGRRQHV
jgi:hypothetical protein